MKKVPQQFIKLSRALRRKGTPWEIKLWQALRDRRFLGLRFKRQARMGNYIVDFYCPEKRLIIELDGGHHNEEGIKSRDRHRENYLRDVEGCDLLRVWNNELDSNFEGVLEAIEGAVS
ncbi:MAG: endonuclease domain-containing protein [Candidatus Doudnabacteria bacterium]|nr:endonuclease domain-containing protein [Candidatus Doudnabacteria bacterium]